MPTIKLLSWHADIVAKATSLKAKGITIDASPLVRTSAVISELARSNPAALVLDLDRLASNSRQIALMLRASKSARHIPILFAGAEPSEEGLPEKYARLKSELPDIPYAIWPNALSGLKQLLEQPRTEPSIVPPPRVYTTPLAQKLGILTVKTQSSPESRQFTLLGAPEGFAETLGDLPDTVKFTSKLNASTHLALCFIRSWPELAVALDLLTLRLPKKGSAWIVYPKRSSNKHSDFSERNVRESGLAAGFVDYKICSIDKDWSALKFAHRKPKSS